MSIHTAPVGYGGFVLRYGTSGAKTGTHHYSRSTDPAATGQYLCRFGGIGACRRGFDTPLGKLSGHNTLARAYFHLGNYYCFYTPQYERAAWCYTQADYYLTDPPLCAAESTYKWRDFVPGQC